MNRLLQILAGTILTGTILTAPSREARLEATLRRIVEAHALAMWANTSADHATYERLANDRDDAIEAACEMVAR